MKRFKKGQSVLEYVLVLTAIIGVIALAASGAIKDAVTGLMSKAATTIDTAAGNMP